MNSNQRILNTFFALYQNKSVSADKLSEHYDISLRTTQRDLATIREEIIDHQLPFKLTYDSFQHTFSLENKDQLREEEVLILCKVLLESRSLAKNELELVITHLLSTLSTSSRQRTKNLFSNELLDYYPLQHHVNLLDKIAFFSHYISNRITIHFHYKKNQGEQVERLGLPVSLYFSEYYFYVLLFNPKYNNYLIYRLDRFLDIHETKEKITIPYKNRLQESDLRKKLFLMYAGKETTFTFRFWGITEAALDKLPQSKVIKTFEDGSTVIEAIAQDKGVQFWLLSQGSNVQVLSPPSFVEKIKQEIDAMQKRYVDK
ncbi:MAG: helix-turn-helix transcriptional regulator [Enterococcus sp.]